MPSGFDSAWCRVSPAWATPNEAVPLPGLDGFGKPSRLKSRVGRSSGTRMVGRSHPWMGHGRPMVTPAVKITRHRALRNTVFLGTPRALGLQRRHLGPPNRTGLRS